MKTKIHPAIGIARLGNSAEYLLAPETPGGLPIDPATDRPVVVPTGNPPVGVFRDARAALKKQAARFKVYLYDDGDPSDPGTLVQPGTTRLGAHTVKRIEWTVYLANKKASWFQFKQLTGSGMEGDRGYDANNAANPDGRDRDLPYNPLRYNEQLGTSADPKTFSDQARRALVLDPGPQTVSGPNAPAAVFAIPAKGLQPFDIDNLGSILTDAEGTLLVLAGEGRSGATTPAPAIGDYANNPGWFDDTADGPVTAILVLDDNSRVPVDVPAWAICGPPAYAPQVSNLVTLYDTMLDVFVREFGLRPELYAGGQFVADYQPDLADEITPFLPRPDRYRFVVSMPKGASYQHGLIPTESANAFRSQALSVIRGPEQRNESLLMPVLAGDNPLDPHHAVSNYLTVTATQKFVLRQYAAGKAVSTPAPDPGAGPRLDRAHLENCVGGAFCPGIEITWISRNPTLYTPLPPKPALSDAFRFRHKDLSGGLTLENGRDNDYSAGLEPGDATKYMAQPWQADFNECSVQPIKNDNRTHWWWPAQRPYSVYPLAERDKMVQALWARAKGGQGVFDDLQMVSNWKDLGLIVELEAGAVIPFVEIERNQAAIDAYAAGGPST